MFFQLRSFSLFKRRRPTFVYAGYFTALISFFFTALLLFFHRSPSTFCILFLLWVSGLSASCFGFLAVGFFFFFSLANLLPHRHAG